jgi:hypothetical protein
MGGGGHAGKGGGGGSCIQSDGKNGTKLEGTGVICCVWPLAQLGPTRPAPACAIVGSRVVQGMWPAASELSLGCRSYLNPHDTRSPVCIALFCCTLCISCAGASAASGLAPHPSHSFKPKRNILPCVSRTSLCCTGWMPAVPLPVFPPPQPQRPTPEAPPSPQHTCTASCNTQVIFFGGGVTVELAYQLQEPAAAAAAAPPAT